MTADPITYLFVPGHRPDRFDKAVASGADAVILDLEDAVGVEEKARARDDVANWFRSKDARVQSMVVVRINDAQSPWFEDDLALLGDTGIRHVMLPKAENAAQIERIRERLGPTIRCIPIIESARGLVSVAEIAHAAGVQRLAFGTLDYAVDLNLSGDERGLLYAASQIAIASRCAELASPIAGVTTEINDEQRLLKDIRFAAACGFGAKLCIHPTQVQAVIRAMTPCTSEIEWAERVISATQSQSGVVTLDGKMVDRPVILKARSILARVRG